jgi:catechol 2,3-dioxygenase-like lactoylglutathione lyase family enzyme
VTRSLCSGMTCATGFRNSYADGLGRYSGRVMNDRTPLVKGTDFICIGTQDFDRAVDFYENVLGLEKSKQWGSMPGIEFETGSLTIAVMQSDAFGVDFAPHRHPIEFHVDDVEAARAELESRGVEFRGEILDSGVCHQTFFADPDGNALAIHHRYAPQE